MSAALTWLLRPQTVASVETITQREGWGDLPIYAWGGSAGGTFVARLPFFLHLKVRQPPH